MRTVSSTYPPVNGHAPPSELPPRGPIRPDDLRLPRPIGARTATEGDAGRGPRSSARCEPASGTPPVGSARRSRRSAGPRGARTSCIGSPTSWARHARPPRSSRPWSGWPGSSPGPNACNWSATRRARIRETSAGLASRAIAMTRRRPRPHLRPHRSASPCAAGTMSLGALHLFPSRSRPPSAALVRRLTTLCAMAASARINLRADRLADPSKDDMFRDAPFLRLLALRPGPGAAPARAAVALLRVGGSPGRDPRAARAGDRRRRRGSGGRDDRPGPAPATSSPGSTTAG